jgi:hypothetical protein
MTRLLPQQSRRAELTDLLTLAVSRYADGNAALSTWLASYEKI